MNTLNIPSFAKKATISSFGIGGIVYITITVPLTLLSVAMGAIIGIVTCYCVYIQHLTDITGKGKNN